MRCAADGGGASGFAALPAAARDFVQDQAGMFSPSTVAQFNERIASFNAQTGKEIVVVTTPSLGGATLQSAAAAAFSQQNVNGVLIFIARDDRRDIIVPDRAGTQAGWFTPDVLRSIRTSMEAQFRSENYDAGITGAVDALSTSIAPMSAACGSARAAGAALPARAHRATGGVHISMFWWIIIAIVGFLILRSVLRAMSAPRYYGGTPGAPPGGRAAGRRAAVRATGPVRLRLWRFRRRREFLERIARRSRRRVARQRALPRRRRRHRAGARRARPRPTPAAAGAAADAGADGRATRAKPTSAARAAATGAAAASAIRRRRRFRRGRRRQRRRLVGRYRYAT